MAKRGEHQGESQSSASLSSRHALGDAERMISNKHLDEEHESPVLAHSAAGGNQGATASSLQGKLFHSFKTVAASVKKARTFELQRTIKRIKSAASDAEKDAFETELEAIKRLDHRSVAVEALRSKLVKAGLLPRKRVASEDKEESGTLSTLAEVWNRIVAETVRTEVTGGANEQIIESKRAIARVLSNKSLADEVSRQIDTIRQALAKRGHDGLQEKESGANNEHKREKRKRVDEAASSAGSAKAFQRAAKQTRSTDMASSNQQAAAETQPLSSSVESTDEDDEGVEDSGPEEYEVSDEDEKRDQDHFNLPTLSTGFVAGRGLRLGRDDEDDDDDEWSDGDAEIDEYAEMEGGKKIRKNRMGQRARRAISEKKYGKNANHLRLRKADEGWQAKEQPAHRKSANHASSKPQHDRQSRAGGDSASQTSLRFGSSAKNWAATSSEQPLARVPSTNRDVLGTALAHPSWIAKQRQKEREQEALQARRSAAANKIVFD